jgi:hypothetical protein
MGHPSPLYISRGLLHVYILHVYVKIYTETSTHTHIPFYTHTHTHNEILIWQSLPAEGAWEKADLRYAGVLVGFLLLSRSRLVVLFTVAEPKRGYADLRYSK